MDTAQPIKPQRNPARRITIYRSGKKIKRWRYKVQGRNWQVIDAPEQGFMRRSTAMKRAMTRWPDAQEVVVR